MARSGKALKALYEPFSLHHSTSRLNKQGHDAFRVSPPLPEQSKVAGF
jgi:hypothetical protein